MRVALLGFNSFERATFESYFRLVSGSGRAFVHEPKAAAADFVIADADDATVVARLERRGWLGRAVLVGATRRSEALLQMPRPIDLMRILKALEREPLAAPSLPDAATPAQRVLDELAFRTGVIPAGVDPRALAAGPARPSGR